MPMLDCPVHGRRWHTPTDPPRCPACAHGATPYAGSVEEMLVALAAEVEHDRREHRDRGDDLPNWD